jgi:hypothetical protein
MGRLEPPERAGISRRRAPLGRDFIRPNPSRANSLLSVPIHSCVRFAVAVTDAYATLATGRPATALPVPVFHRLEHASFA